LIGEKWIALGGEQSPVGRAITDESDASGGGRFNNFEKGYIYWSPATGAHAVYGEIGKKWDELGRERGALGYPITDEEPAENGARISRFQHAAIYWSPQTGAIVHNYDQVANANSAKCLDVVSGSTEDQANVQQFTCRGTDNQR